MSDDRKTGKSNGRPRSAGKPYASSNGRPHSEGGGRPSGGRPYASGEGSRPVREGRRPGENGGSRPAPARGYAPGGRPRSEGGGYRPGEGGGSRPAPAKTYAPGSGRPRPEGGSYRPGETGGSRPAPARGYAPGGGRPRSEGGSYRPGETGGSRPAPAKTYAPGGGRPRSEGGSRPAPAPGGDRPRSEGGNRPAPARGYAPGSDRPRSGFSQNRPAAGRPGPSGGFRAYGNPARRPVPVNRARPSGPYGKPAETETTGLSLNARRLALTILRDVHENGAFASLSLNEHLPKGALKPEDRRLVTSIVYGTLENQIKIDYALDRLMEHPTREPAQRDILRMSAYQILFLDRVPDSAAVNEGVKLIKAMDMESASGFINAVLRNLVRGKDTLEWPRKEADFRLWLHVMSSTPLWLVDRLIGAYGEDEAENLLMYRESAHPVVVRPNMTKLTDEQFENLLQSKKLAFTKGVAPHAYLLSGVSELGFDPDYQSGKFSIQGQSSMLAAEAVQAKPGMKILDACAAPGGKSAYMCECMEMTGRVFAWELHEKRAMLLDGVKRRLRLDNLRVSVRDAADFRDDLLGALDAVLLDAPCSGTGVMLQKPDVKLRLQESDIAPIVETQEKLLNTLCRYVKPGGALVYSTCSVLPEENKRQIAAFLERHPEFTVEPLPTSFPAALRQQQDDLGLQLLGYRDGVEGFYIVRLRRMR